jgi:hypothetical protein
MKAIDLEGEMAQALDAVKPVHREMLRKAGVPSSVVELVGVDRVLVEDGGGYQPHELGRARFIIPVRIADRLSPESPRPFDTVVAGKLVDLIAFHPGRPAEWSPRTGNATWLGACETQKLQPPPVPVHRTPVDWLKAGCVGIVPLVRDPVDLAYLLRPLETIVIDDEQYGIQIATILTRPPKGPSIMLRAAGRA